MLSHLKIRKEPDKGQNPYAGDLFWVRCVQLVLRHCPDTKNTHIYVIIHFYVIYTLWPIHTVYNYISWICHNLKPSYISIITNSLNVIVIITYHHHHQANHHHHQYHRLTQCHLWVPWERIWVAACIRRLNWNTWKYTVKPRKANLEMCKIHAAWSRSCTSWRSPYH